MVQFESNVILFCFPNYMICHCYFISYSEDIIYQCYFKLFSTNTVYQCYFKLFSRELNLLTVNCSDRNNGWLYFYLEAICNIIFRFRICILIHRDVTCTRIILKWHVDQNITHSFPIQWFISLTLFGFFLDFLSK